MDDKALMEDMLMTVKGVCDLYMHGAIESGTASVQQTFHTALNDTLKMQDALYQKMTAKGWYTTQSVDDAQRNQVKQQFAAN